MRPLDDALITSKILTKGGSFMKNVCPNCKEMYFHLNEITKLRHDTHSCPVEQKVEVKYCPECGAALVEFQGFINERMYG